MKQKFIFTGNNILEMGNVCSSSKKKNKDTISERSEESPSYQLSSKRNSKANKDQINDKLAPLADTELSADLINQSKNGTAGKTSISKSNIPDSVTSTPQAMTAPEELTSKTSLPHNLIPLQGRPRSSRRTEKDKKIILYILSSGYEHNIEKAVLSDLYEILKERCDVRGFELIYSDNHSQFETAEDKHQILDILQWKTYPLEAQGGHDEAANCLADVVRHTNASYMVPILFLGTSLGRPLLPLTIESQDFSTVYSSATEKLQTLLNKWYKLDDTELKDSYLTTIVEQEIHNTVLISQELAKRCMWVQTGIFPIKVSENVGLVEMENCQRLMNLHSELKNQLPEKNLIRIPPSIQVKDDQLSSIMESILKSILDGIFDEHTQKYSIPNCTFGVNKKLLSEIETTGQYSKMLGQNCANFTILEDIKRYVMEDSSAPLIILGEKGSGKSVLTSKIMNYIHVWSPEFNLILRYSHLTEMSSNITSLMGSIADQFSILLKGSISECKHSIITILYIILSVIRLCICISYIFQPKSHFF
uniref:Uncharacterized protein n=1 Tax=Megaselia scalaris TaxID=36166 RepID=T1GM97_MEGSC